MPALKRVDYFVMTKTNLAEPSQLNELLAWLKEKSSKPIFQPKRQKATPTSTKQAMLTIPCTICPPSVLKSLPLLNSRNPVIAPRSIVAPSKPKSIACTRHSKILFSRQEFASRTCADFHTCQSTREQSLYLSPQKSSPTLISICLLVCYSLTERSDLLGVECRNRKLF